LILSAHPGEDTIVMPDEPPPSSSVTRARNGDKRARGMVAERCAPVIWSICRQHGPSRQDTDDVGLSVWLRLAGRIDTLREPAALHCRLASTTHRECSKVLRVARKRSAGGYSSDPETVPDDQLAPGEHWLFIAERDAALREALTVLSPRCQHLLPMLVANPPVSCAQISATPGIAARSIGPIRRGCLDALCHRPRWPR
jgi:DNA-directed RNA polymerase specialized sigma24 family protein